jgi:hypothetical protein
MIVTGSRHFNEKFQTRDIWNFTDCNPGLAMNGPEKKGGFRQTGSMPPLVGVPYCRPGIHGVAPTVRQQGTPTRGSHCTNHFRFHFSFQIPLFMAAPGPGFHSRYLCDQRRVPGGPCGLNPILTCLLHGVGHGEAVRTANCLRTYLPAVFAVQRSHALLHVKRGRG